MMQSIEKILKKDYTKIEMPKIKIAVIYSYAQTKLVISKRNIEQIAIKTRINNLKKKSKETLNIKNSQQYTGYFINKIVKNTKNIINSISPWFININTPVYKPTVLFSNDILKIDAELGEFSEILQVTDGLKLIISANIKNDKNNVLNLPFLSIAPSNLFPHIQLILKDQILNRLIRPFTLIERNLAEAKYFLFNFNKNSKINIPNLYVFINSVFNSMKLQGFVSKPIIEILPSKIVVKFFYYLLNGRKRNISVRNNNNSWRNNRKSKKFIKLFRVNKFKNKKKILKRLISSSKNKDNKYNTYNKSDHGGNFYGKTMELGVCSYFTRFKDLNKRVNLLRSVINNRIFKNFNIKDLNSKSIFYIQNEYKLQIITQLISNLYKKPVILSLTKLYHPFYDCNILVNLLGLLINNNKLRRIRRMLFVRAFIKNPLNLNNKYKSTKLPSYIRGAHIRVAGHQNSKRIIPRRTVNTIRKGALARGKIHSLDNNRFIGKSKRGTYAITIKMSHNLYFSTYVR